MSRIEKKMELIRTINKISPVRLLLQAKRARAALRYGYENSIVGSDFARFGTSIGKQLLIKRVRGGIGFLLAPVSITRYFEFQFVRESLLTSAIRCLDVSSPRLFSLFTAHQSGSARSIKMCNPDSDDIQRTQIIAEALNLQNMTFSTESVLDLGKQKDTFDCIWSISVVEHISGDYDDCTAAQLMFNALRPGGRLILTVPTDKRFWNEYRSEDYYGTQPREDNNYFFQRFYDFEAIKIRLLAPIGMEPTIIRWFGETENGHFHKYIERRLGSNDWVSIEDPYEIVDHYEEYLDFASMPGAGVCGLVIDK